VSFDEIGVSAAIARSKRKRCHRPAMRACDNACRVTDATWAVVEAKLAETWSPEQISNYLRANDQPRISHESIYQRI
jgi:IS30 family transposase